MEALGDLPVDVTLFTEPEGAVDWAHLFCRDRADLARLGPAVLDACMDEGVLWVSYPKRSSKVETDLTRDVGWDLLAEAGLRPVTQVSVDEVWSALRFRPIEQVKR